jgi:GMP synthase (glutamine-hydrolysing)
MTNETIAILDFGSQYTQLIARRVRELSVFSTVLRYDTPSKEIRKLAPKGIILSGGPASVYAPKAPQPDKDIFKLGIPMLGICYGTQLMGFHLGGKVAHSDKREYGRAEVRVRDASCPLFRNVSPTEVVWMSHGDRVEKLPKGFSVVADSAHSPVAAMEDRARHFYGIQFHPEVVHTPRGKEILSNFVYGICGCSGNWTMHNFIEQAKSEIRAKVGSDRVILGLSGGVDSSVAAVLIHEAIGDQLTCVFVNNGLLRKGEAEQVQEVFGEHFHIRLKYVDAAKRFLAVLKGITDPERKRKIIGREFIRVFESAVARLQSSERQSVRASERQKNARTTLNAQRSHAPYRFLAQGTLYPDVIESVPIGDNPAALIKSHHNVGGLPKRMKFELLEPLRTLFKDEVRKVGEALGLPKEVVWRQPFPGPGLAVRILGEITPSRIRILQEADGIVVEEMKKSGWYYKIWQSFAVLLPIRTVGVMGDERTYDHVIAIRAVDSQDGMTADWVQLPYDLLGTLSTRIINEVKGVNRVCFDISSKPPSTIEWE